MNRILSAVIGFLGLAASTLSLAQDYPTKPVTLIIPFAAGGPTDVIGRMLAQGMSPSLNKQTVLVENVVGAGGTLAAGRVARSAPDGYTIFLHHNGMATSVALYRKLEFNPLTDFEYIGLVADVPMTLVSRRDLPPKDFKELLGYIK